MDLDRFVELVVPVSVFVDLKARFGKNDLDQASLRPFDLPCSDIHEEVHARVRLSSQDRHGLLLPRPSYWASSTFCPGASHDQAQERPAEDGGDDTRMHAADRVRRRPNPSTRRAEALQRAISRQSPPE